MSTDTYIPFEDIEVESLLNQLAYDSTTPKFIEIESIVMHLIELDRTLEVSYRVHLFDGDLTEHLYSCGKDISTLLGVGTLQCLYVQQDCLQQLYRCLLGEKLTFPPSIRKIREARNMYAGHPAGRQIIPQFDLAGIQAIPFDESKEAPDGVFFEEILAEQRQFVKRTISEIIMKRQDGNIKIYMD